MIEAEKKLKEVRSDAPSWAEKFVEVFAPQKRKERTKKLQEVEKEWKGLSQERDQAIEKAALKAKEDREICHLEYKKNSKRILDQLDPLKTEYREIEEVFFSYGDLHPRLLGFRAKKQFSFASIKISGVHFEMVLLPSGAFIMGDERHFDADPEALPKREVKFQKNIWFSSFPR